MDPVLSLIVGLAAGAALGGWIGWLLALRRAPDPRIETELRARTETQETELRQLREKLGETQRILAGAEAQKDSVEKNLAEQRRAHEEALRAARESQDKAIQDLRESFKALSVDALKQTHPEFLRLANETLGKFQETAKGDLAQRQESIKTLIEPLKQQLEAYQRRLQQSESTQSSTLGEVRKQMEMLSQHSQSLAQETQQFRMVLRSNQARGRWGEETLRRVIEAGGLSAHCDFSEQTQAGDSKPDLIVRLPGNRVIIVDAKVPDLDFLQALDASDNAKRSEALALHATKLKATIKTLADRDYPKQFANSLDYVVLFVPAESLFSAALEGDRDLIVWAAQKRILLATPASFIALLRSVSVSWQQHDQTENAREIAAAARDLYGRVAKFTEHFEKIRAALDRANSAYNDAVGSYERRVRPAGERLMGLGIDTAGKKPPEIAPLEGNLQLPPAGENTET